MAAQADDAVGVDGAVHLDDRAGGQGAVACCVVGWWWPGRHGAAQPQLVKVLCGQVRWEGPHELSANEDVHAVLVRPHVRQLPGIVGAYLDPLRARQDAEHAGGGDDGVELDRVDAGGQ